MALKLSELREHNAALFNEGGLGFDTKDVPPETYFTQQAQERIETLDELIRRKEPKASKQEIEEQIGKVVLSLDLLATRRGIELEDCVLKGYEAWAKQTHYTKKRSLSK